MCRVLAKSNGVSLSEHVRDFFRVLEGLEKALGTYDFWGEIEELLHYAGFSHDLGKVQPAFQIKSLRNTEYQPFELSFEIPHSLASLFFMNVEALKGKLRERNDGNDKECLRLFLSAVAFHHFRENFTEYLWKDNPHLLRFCRKFVDDVEWRKTLLQNLREELKDFQKLQELLNVNLKLAKALINGLTLLDFIFLSYAMEGFPTRIGIPKEQERLFIHLSGFLQRCDHFASFCEEEGKEFPPEEEGLCGEELWGKITDGLRKKSKFDTLWQEEYLEGLEDQSLILVAPTGYGKTEFAFLWSGGKKLFYTLPLRAAVNQMHKRAEEVWGGDRVALLHSMPISSFWRESRLKGQKRKVRAGYTTFPGSLRFRSVFRLGTSFSPMRFVPPDTSGFTPLFPTLAW